MYGTERVAGACVGVGAVCGVTALPNTGSNVWTALAVAVAAGLIVWGVYYAKRSAAQK